MRKLDIAKFADRGNEFRPQMNGVFHDGGFQVASDTVVMVAVRADYPAELEQKVIGRDGQEIKTPRYPRWRAAIPDGRGEVQAINTEAVRDLLRRERTEKALAKKAGGCGRCGYIKVGSAFFRATTFRKVCDFMDAYNSNGLHVFGPGRPAYVEAPDGSLAVIMPSAVRNYWLEDRENHLWLEF